MKLKVAERTVELQKVCPVCQRVFGPLAQDSPDPVRRSRERYLFKKRRFCGIECVNAAQRRVPTSRTGASKQAQRLKPRRPCERCGETRMSEVHHRDRNWLNNAPENLERLCLWCHKAEHGGEEGSRAAHKGWAKKRGARAVAA